MQKLIRSENIEPYDVTQGQSHPKEEIHYSRR